MTEEECLPTLDEVRLDYARLDKWSLEPDEHHKVVVMQDFDPKDSSLTRVIPTRGVSGLCARLGDWCYAVKLLRATGPNDCLLVNTGEAAGKLACFLNQVFTIRRRKIIAFGGFIQAASGFKKAMVRKACSGALLNSVWSKKQIKLQADYLKLPEEKFFVIAYKANHSKRPPLNVTSEPFVFAGGNSGRDYATLFEAVRGTGIQMMVSTTSTQTVAGLEIPENVHIVGVREPEFGRLMATARFMVMAIRPGLLRGAGEATILNAMWQKRPVVVADDLSAYEYIQNGLTGYVVPSGEVEALRKRMVELWEHPEQAREMGRVAHQAVRDRFQHKHFIRRLKTLALLAART